MPIEGLEILDCEDIVNTVAVLGIGADLGAVLVRPAAGAEHARLVDVVALELVGPVGHNYLLHLRRGRVDAPRGRVAVLLLVRVGGLEVALAATCVV